jgi:deazaflavin-dependent oxidoreductase (nitroreductase family)
MSVEKNAALDVVRIMNKHVLNPAMLRLAGRKHFYASVIRHEGRHTGKEYRTPVVADRVVDGFVIPLPYGQHADWAQNLLAKGTGTLEHGGQSYAVTSPTVISASTAEAELPPRQRRVFERLGVRQFLHLNVVAE